MKRSLPRWRLEWRGGETLSPAIETGVKVKRYQHFAPMPEITHPVLELPQTLRPTPARQHPSCRGESFKTMKKPEAAVSAVEEPCADASAGGGEGALAPVKMEVDVVEA